MNAKNFYTFFIENAGAAITITAPAFSLNLFF